MPKSPILLTDEIVPPPALVRAGLEALPAIIRTHGEHARRRFIEFFTASIRTATPYRNGRARWCRSTLKGPSFFGHGIVAIMGRDCFG
jgi:hypothetical protein